MKGLSYYCHGSDTRERDTSFPLVILPATAARRPLCACVLIKYHLDGGAAWKFLAPILVFMSSAPHRQYASAMDMHTHTYIIYTYTLYVQIYIILYVDIYIYIRKHFVSTCSVRIRGVGVWSTAVV